MIRLTCPCCHFEQKSPDADAAFQAGWDAPPNFSHTCCQLCPGVCVVLGLSHAKAHALWEKNGRPAEFTYHSCGLDKDIVVTC